MPRRIRWQEQVADDRARFKVACIGRRAGKTQLGVMLCLLMMLCGGTAWWVAPTYKVAKIGWRLLKRLASQIPGVDISESELVITFPNGGRVEVRSAHDPDTLRGDSIDLLVVDEAAYVQEGAWTESLRPALADRRGRALFISTPNGFGWFHRLFQLGLDPLQSEWRSWQLPTSVNPFIAPEEIEAARQSMPARAFEQEFRAVFVPDAGAVFRRLMAAAVAQEQERAIAGHRYPFSVDSARDNDYTVISVLDATTRELVQYDRFNRIDYEMQKDRLLVLKDRFHPYTIVIEANSAGQALIDALVRLGLPIQPFLTTNASKQLAVDELTLAFEQERLKILPDPLLISELQSFTGTKLPSGLMHYGAPQGAHDDFVMSLAIGWYALEHPQAALAGAGLGLGRTHGW